MSKTVYLKLNQITEIHRKDVALKDVAEVYCEDKNIQNKCSAMKVKHITGDRKHRYVMSALEVIEKLEQLDSAIQVNNVGEVDFIIAYQPPTPPCTPGSGPRRCSSALSASAARPLPS